MERIDDFTFALRVALIEAGHFECKCSFVPDDGGEPTWAEGRNVHVNVEPPSYCCSNSIYCAFVRQFGANKNKPFSTLADGITQDELKKFDKNGYALIPGSGTFRDLIKELDHIVGDLRCRIIHLLPVNPTPTVYGRMGRFGSPYASLDFTGINPELAEFDRKATPLDQFIELADEIHKRDAKLFIDIAINHTGWAAKLHETNPDWFVRDPNGDIHSPGAWGVTWGDLTELDHSKLELWKYLADVFLVWCRRGVDGFRCDAGYMIPAPAWEYITARVRSEYTDTIFLLEGLGGDPEVTRTLLDKSNLDWAYSELFQNYSRQQIEGYLRYAWSESSSHGLMVNYAETHDNNRLAATSNTYSSMRTALAALSSTGGAFGFANGVEWFAKEKIDVHEASALNWGAQVNQNALIRRLNVILAEHPAFHTGAMMEILDCGSANAVLFSRTDSDSQNGVVVAVNLELNRAVSLEWDPSYTPFLHETEEKLFDLISERSISLVRTANGKFGIQVQAGKFLCLTTERSWQKRIDSAEKSGRLSLDRVTLQTAKSMALRLYAQQNGTSILPLNEIDETALAKRLLESPEDFLRSLDPGMPCGKFVLWQWPQDAHREVMLPPDHSLLVVAPYRFTCRICDGNKVYSRRISIQDASGRHFVLRRPVPETKFKRLTLEIRVYPENQKTVFGAFPLLLLPKDISNAATSFDRAAIYNRDRVFLQANGCGAIIHQRMELEKLDSRYDAILLANLNPDYPEDRHIMWRRIRISIVWRARKQELKHEHLHSFHVAADGGGVWDYLVPAGNGLFVELSVKMQILPGKNAVLVTVCRHHCDKPKRLPDDTPIRVFIRPDIEDRNFHCTTKAAQGPEACWPSRINAKHHVVEFRASENRILRIMSPQGFFIRKDQWLYSNWMEKEASRGLDPSCDLYSPGTFRFWLSGDKPVRLLGQICTAPDQLPQRTDLPYKEVGEAPNDIESAALRSLSAFVVKRDDLKTVIAGYPWFLDWGRDTLIAARGLIAAPQFRDDVRKILLQFAKFEENGTIPNMISGSDARNRDTSDAPLWLFTATADLCKAEASDEFLDTIVRGKQTLRDILIDLAQGIIRGTPNGIKCDPESMLVFSPPHFTWMDTNYPAGTPREGYPIEIQALWYAALAFLARITKSAASEEWNHRAECVRASIMKYFRLPGKNYFSDCLHCKSGTPASKAVADDHLRPNQLYAITLGAINDRKICTGILAETACLLIPGAIRSLADLPVEYKLPIKGPAGNDLNDPSRPYWGRYEGDEDTRRKPAYHNGTAWTWQFPSYSEAYYMIYGEFGKDTAKSLLSSMILQMDGGCIMQLPEILDGDAPHTPRGCDAQAWGMSEFYRVWKLLHS